MNITIRVDGLPKMANGSYGTWHRRAAETKKWKTLVARELCGLAPSRPWRKVHVTFTRRSSVEPDYDGLVHGFKPLRDALVRYGFVVDDKNRNLEAVYRWEATKRGDGHVELAIVGVEP